MNRKKLASKITTLVLCAAVIITAANWNDLKGLFIKEIVATEEQGNEKILEGTTITRFDDKKTEVNLSTPNGLSNINDYLPKTIKAVMDDESEKEIKILNWKFVSAEAPKDGKYKYVYEAQTEDAYALGKDTEKPFAYVYIKESEINKDTVVDNGVYSISAKKKAEVCPECFRELDGDRLCSECHKKDCKCPETDIDLKNMNSILAFGKKYVSENFIGFDMIYPEIFELDTDWIRSLPENKREVIDILFRAYRYENEPEFYTYISALGIKDFLAFLDNNILGFTFEDYKQNGVLNLSLSQIKKLSDKIPDFAMKDIYFNVACMRDNSDIRDNIDSKKEEKELKKIADQVSVRKKVSFSCNKKSSLKFSSLKTEQEYIKNLCSSEAADAFGAALGRGSVYMNYVRDTQEDNGNGPYARYYLRGKGGNGSDNIYSPAFCGNHGLPFAGSSNGDAKFYHVGTASETKDCPESQKDSCIGSALAYIATNYKSLAGLQTDSPTDKEVHLYTIIQSTIWNATDTGGEKWRTQTSFKSTCTTVCNTGRDDNWKQSDLCALWWLFRYGGEVATDGKTITVNIPDTTTEKTVYNVVGFTENATLGEATHTLSTFSLKGASPNRIKIKRDDDYDIWRAANDGDNKQPMLTPMNMELPLIPHIKEAKETIRTKMVVRHNINNHINDKTGEGVIAKWYPITDDPSTAIEFNTPIDNIKNKRHAFYYASKKYDGTTVISSSDNPKDWKDNHYITENDNHEGKYFDAEWRYISPLFYNPSTQFFNYAYKNGDEGKNDSDYMTCIKRHLYGKDALKNIKDDASLEDLKNLPYQCSTFDCEYPWHFSGNRASFDLSSSHFEELIISQPWLYSVDDDDKKVAKDYENDIAESFLDYRKKITPGGVIVNPMPSFEGDTKTINIKKFGSILISSNYTTFNNNYIGWDITETQTGPDESDPYYYNNGTAEDLESGATETVNAPETLKHKLILNYQGGYLKNPSDIATIDKATDTFITTNEKHTDAIYEKAKVNENKYTNVKTTETVGATYKGMTKKEYTFDSNSENIEASKIVEENGDRERYKFSTSSPGDGNPPQYNCEEKEGKRYEINAEETGNLSKLEGRDEDSSREFTYGKIDGLETVIDFNYEGDYVASLPDPSRYGYNFIGWYTEKNAEGKPVSAKTDIEGKYNGKKALILDEKTLSNGRGATATKNNDTLELYAAWELITKDQSFYIDWMDNNNRYSTRPDTVYVQLYRTTEPEDLSFSLGLTNKSNYEQVTKFVTDNIGSNRFEDSVGDWVTRFSNETGIDNKGGGIGQESSKGKGRYTFGKKGKNESSYSDLTDPNDKIYNPATGESDIPNPYKAFKGNGKYSDENYMKVSLYKDINSNASSPRDIQEGIIEGTNSSPASSNRWVFTLKDLQKFKTKGYISGTEEWKEYQYVIKQIHAISKDYTLRYVLSPTNLKFENGYGEGNESVDKTKTNPKEEDDITPGYGSMISNYYTMDSRSTSNDEDNNSKDEYNELANKSFGNGVINRLANIYDEPEENLTYDSQKRSHTYKSVQGSIMFVDGTDKFHFRPYSMVVDLYQNTSANRHDDSYPEKDLNLYGVREIIQSQPIVRQGNPYSAVTNGNLNVFEYKFDHVPTLQEETGIKYGYDVVLTHNQKRYRYTINTNDASDNFFRTVANNECFSYVHKDIITTPVDMNLSANETGGNSNIDYEANVTDLASILPIYQSLLYSNYTITSQSSDNTIFKGLTKNVTPKQISENYGKINQYAYNNYPYSADYKGQVASNYKNPSFPVNLYQGKYCSMAYNLRYYYITENRELTIKKEDFNVKTYPDQDLEEDKGIGGIDYYYNMSVPEDHKDKELQYKETLKWNFIVTLNGGEDDSTSLPTEYTGSESPDDRSGIFSGEEGGSYNSDYTHTQNKLIVKSNVFADDGKLNSANNNYTKTETYTAKPNAKDYERLAAYKECEGFLLTFRQVKKSWLGSGDDVREDYKDNESPLNGFRVNKYTSDDKLSDIHKSFAETVPSGTPAPTDKAYKATAVGNEYNLIVPAEGQTEMMYLPDGRYEITCHADIDLHSFSFIDNGDGRTTAVEKKNNRWFITFSSTSNQTKDTSAPDGQEPVPFDVKNAERENVSDMTHRSELDWWRGYVDDAANIAFRNGTEVDQSFRDHKYDLLTPTNSQHHPTVVLQSEDNINYNKYNNTTKDAGEIQRNGFQVNTWKGEYKDASDTTDKTNAPLQYNNPNEKHGKNDNDAFKIVHNYDAFYIGSHSWAEIRENLRDKDNEKNPNNLAEYGQEPYGIGGTANDLYTGNGPTKSTKPKVTGPNTNRITIYNAPYIDTATGKFRTGIIKNWKSSMKQSDKNADGNSILYTKPKTK